MSPRRSRRPLEDTHPLFRDDHPLFAGRGLAGRIGVLRWPEGLAVRLSPYRR
jgi:hypothetical protein